MAQAEEGQDEVSEIGLTDEERAKFPPGTPALVVLAHRVERLGVRCSHLEGTARVHRGQIDTAEAKSEGDRAAVDDLVRRVRKLEAAALGVLRGIGDDEIPARIDEVIASVADHGGTRTSRDHWRHVADTTTAELERVAKSRDHFAAKLTEARGEQERDLAALCEAIGLDRPMGGSRPVWQAAIERVRATVMQLGVVLEERATQVRMIEGIERAMGMRE